MSAARRMPRGAALLAAVFAIAGCRHRASLEMTPSNFSECGGPNVVAHVKWRASDNPDDPISIYVSSVGQPPKLWYTGAHSGELDTGPWMSDGATLLLQDARGKVLARRTMTSTDCPPGAPVAGH